MTSDQPRTAKNKKKVPTKLIQSVETSWNSKCLIFDRLYNNQWPICSVLSDPRITRPTDAKTLELKDKHWGVICDLLPSLKALKVG